MVDVLDKNKIMKAVSLLLEGLGEDLNREGLKETPKRVADFYEEFRGGAIQNPNVFFLESSELTIIKDITFYSICEHHLLPFFGTIAIAYVSKKKVPGLSKVVRLVYSETNRLSIQERITRNIADGLLRLLKKDQESVGVMVVSKARHLCMEMRGVKNPCETIISTIRGSFVNDPVLRQEALNLIG